VLAQPRRKLAELQLLAARLASNRVIVVAGLVADEKHGFDLPFTFTTFGHGTERG
jgi:hypothetical protein